MKRKTPHPPAIGRGDAGSTVSGQQRADAPPGEPLRIYKPPKNDASEKSGGVTPIFGQIVLRFRTNRFADYTGKLISDGNEFVSGAIVVGGFAPYPPHPFLVLIQEKGAKENQAPTGGGETGRVRDGAIEMVSDAGGRRVGAVVGRQGRGELHSPQHVPKRNGGA